MKSFLFFAASKLPYDALALGKFDGMHIAHLRLLDLVGDNGLALSIAQVRPPFITPPLDRQIYTGVPMYRLRFDSIRSLSAIDFLRLLFHVLPHLRRIVVGYDFCFGRNRASSATDLESLLKKLGRPSVEACILESQKHNSLPIHTSIIKELIKYGDLAQAGEMLGRFYALRGRVIAGQGLGRRALYPTINLKTSLYLIPKYGVYASFCQLDSRIYPAVVFIGNRLSTDKLFCIECHLLDWLETPLRPSQKVAIHLVDRLRNNKTFDSLSELKAQIGNDIDQAKAILLSRDMQAKSRKFLVPLPLD